MNLMFEETHKGEVVQYEVNLILQLPLFPRVKSLS